MCSIARVLELINGLSHVIYVIVKVQFDHGTSSNLLIFHRLTKLCQ